MIQAGTMLKVTDKTGVVLVQCIKVFGPIRKRIAYLGDVVLVSVKKINIKKLTSLKAKKKKNIQKVLCLEHLLFVVKSIFVEHLAFLLNLTKIR